MSIVNTYKALIKREFWEHRGAFIKAPIIIGIVLLVVTIGGYITALVLTDKTGSSGVINQLIKESSNIEPAKLALAWDVQMLSISSLYLMVLYFVIFFFLLGSLFDDRKDGSILFWKSLPISDANTVMSKLLTAMVFAPLMFVAVYFIVILILMFVFSIILLIHGANPITLIWSSANIFNGVKVMFVGVFTQMLWALPIYGWLTFSSSISKRRPFLFAVFVPAIVAFSWYWINLLSFKFTYFEMFSKPISYVAHAVAPYGSGGIKGNMFSFNSNDGSFGLIGIMLDSIASLDILYGFIFCAVFVALAIWIRRYRNTT